MTLQFSNLKDITKGNILQFFEDFPIQHLLTDSRKLTINKAAIFFAISGTRHDGHKFINELYRKGIRQFVVEKKPDLSVLREANILHVSDTIEALQKIAAYHRSQFDLQVVGITGSNGKTIVKEWLSQLLSPRLKVVKSPKSYNSQIGVPLSVWQIHAEHEIGIFEAGISLPGEMSQLQTVIRPTIGIFTNIGTAHDEGFSSRELKVLEKISLFQGAEKIIFCNGHTAVKDALSKTFSSSVLFSWGTEAGSDIKVISIKKESSASIIDLTYLGKALEFTLPFNDDASVENCMHCIAFLLEESFPPAYIQQQINYLDTIPKRLELKQAVNECYLIDDSYNNDFAGLQIALDFMGQQKQKDKKTIILSDLLQTGLPEEILYRNVAELLHNRGITKMIGIGSAISGMQGLFEMESEFYVNTESFLESFDKNFYEKELILIKGARAFKFGRIVNLLQQKMHGTVLEINLDALTNNLNFYRSRLDPSIRMMVMVKAFAYGSGSQEIANLLQFHRVDYLAVAYSDEGVTLRESGITVPIMVMNPAPANFNQIMRYNLEPEIYSMAHLKSWINFVDTVEKVIPIHLKLDTGMHRLGFERAELDELIRILVANKKIKVASIFTHLAGSDEAHHNEFSHHQAQLFKEMTGEIISKLDTAPLLHILNSPGIIRFPEYHFDMVRLGIGLYGVEVNQQFQEQLIPISTLKTTISQIKKIGKGESVGYSRRGVAENDMTTATIAIGYADGFNRRFSNGKGRVLINNREAPVIGNVCMDMTMVDITGISADEGDEVIVFGAQRSIATLAAEIGTIPYEILTNVSERVKRVFFSE